MSAPCEPVSAAGLLVSPPPHESGGSVPRPGSSEDPGPGSFYRRLGAAAQRFGDPAWLAEHFADDRQAAVRFLEAEFLADAWDRYRLAFDDLYRLLQRFPDRADWLRAEDNPLALWEDLRHEDEARRRGQADELGRRQRRAERQAFRAFLDAELRHRLLLAIRDGAWWPLWRVTPALARFIPDNLARRRYEWQHGPGNRLVGSVGAQGRQLLCEDALARLRGLKLVEVRDGGDEGPLVRATPRTDDRVIVDEEFARLLPTSPAEDARFAERLLAEGCRDALVVWRQARILVDGHRRFRIQCLLGRSYALKEMDFPDRAAALHWAREENYTRRNYTEEMKAEHRGRVYLAGKQPRGGDRRSGQAKSQRATLNALAERLAREFGRSRATIYRDARFAADLAWLAEHYGEPIRAWVLTRGGHASHTRLRAWRTLPAEVVRQAVADTLAADRWAPLDRAKRPPASAGFRLPSHREDWARVLFTRLGPDASRALAEALVALALAGPEAVPDLRS